MPASPAKMVMPRALASPAKMVRPPARVNPAKMEINAPNGRHYRALTLSALLEYYYPYAVAFAGNTYRTFEERKDLLRRTMFEEEMIFSGQEKVGYVIFPLLDHDVQEFTLEIEGMALRFDFLDEPVETVDIRYRFSRHVYLARHPRTDEP